MQRIYEPEIVEMLKRNVRTVYGCQKNIKKKTKAKNSAGDGGIFDKEWKFKI